MEQDERPLQILNSPLQIAVAGFIGLPMAGCWFFSRNCRELGDTRGAWRWLVIGAGSIVAFFIVGAFLPGFPRMIIPVAYSAGLDVAARRIHGDAFAKHIAAGGRVDSWWTVIGLSLLFFSTTYVVFWSAILASLRWT